MTTSLSLEWLADDLFVYRFPPGARLPNDFRWDGSLVAAVRTAEELSLVTPQRLSTVDGAKVEGPWRAFRVRGTLDFALTGILAGLATPLARAGVSLFAVSTFDTDYVLVRTDRQAAATEALRQAGFVWGA
jgi:hypothetical protein